MSSVEQPIRMLNGYDVTGSHFQRPIAMQNGHDVSKKAPNGTPIRKQFNGVEISKPYMNNHHLVGDNADDDEEDDDDEIKKLEEFDYVRFTVCDINGVGRCKSLPRRHLRGAMKRGGVDIYAGVLSLGPKSNMDHVMPEVLDINYGNGLLVPVPGTTQPLKWATDGEFKIGEILCEVSWVKPYRDGAPQAACPRLMARQQLDRLDRMGYRLYSGFEPEFATFHRDTGKILFNHADVFSSRDLAEFETYLCRLESGLNGAGIDCAVLYIEDAQGQFEIPTAPRFGIEAADMMFRLRQFVKEISLKYNIDACFLCQPILNSINSALHFNHSLWTKAGKNVFKQAPAKGQEDNHEAYMSSVMVKWLRGLLRHAGALTALCSPTVNCYRRIGRPWSPGQADWGMDDRMKAIRVKVLAGAQSDVYIENRLPTGAANPYIIIAATVAAGISGLQGEEGPLPPQGVGKDLPRTLGEALDALERDKVMVEALGEEFVRWFCKMKREVDIECLRGADFEKEMDMYFKLF